MTWTNWRPIHLRLGSEGSTVGGYRFTLAGQEILSDSPLGAVLAQDRVVRVPEPDWGPRPVAPELSQPPEASTLGHGFVAGRQRDLLSWGDEDQRTIRISALGTFSLTSEGVFRHPPDPPDRESSQASGSSEELQQAALGPLLILVLASRGIFCLHCSAVAVGGRTSLFLGESGAGKSTLGAALGDAGWERVADDLLPVEIVDGRLVAWTDFPQLKTPLRPTQACLPIERLYLLDEDSKIRIETLSESEAALALAANTAAARLFPRALLARHLAAMTDWAHRAAVKRLTYPRCFEALPEVARVLAAT